MPTQKSKSAAKGGSKKSFVRRLGLEKAVKLAFGINVKGRIEPSKALNMPRDKVRRITQRALDQINNRQESLHKRLGRMERRDERAVKFNAIVNSMSNWQRKRWAKAGYPGLRQKDIKPLEKYVAIERKLHQ